MFGNQVGGNDTGGKDIDNPFRGISTWGAVFGIAWVGRRVRTVRWAGTIKLRIHPHTF